MKNNKLPVSVAIVAYNEEAVIRRALESCSDIVDDIVIVHDGECTDKTLEIAKEFTNKIFVKQHTGSAEGHRPFSFSQTKNNWVIQLDADEYLGEDFRKELPKLIQKNVSGYTINWLEKKNDEIFFNMVKEVLFQKNRVYFIGSPNEFIKPLKPTDSLVHADVSVINAPQTSNYDSWSYFKKKYSRFLKLQAKVYTMPFHKVSKWNYEGKDWDMNTKLKIQHPIILGIGGMFLKYCIELVRKITNKNSALSTQSILHLMWYNTALYWNVFLLNHKI